MPHGVKTYHHAVCLKLPLPTTLLPFVFLNVRCINSRRNTVCSQRIVVTCVANVLTVKWYTQNYTGVITLMSTLTALLAKGKSNQDFLCMHSHADGQTRVTISVLGLKFLWLQKLPRTVFTIKGPLMQKYTSRVCIQE